MAWQDSGYYYRRSRHPAAAITWLVPEPSTWLLARSAPHHHLPFAAASNEALMSRPRILRLLRIAFSAVCGIVCLLVSQTWQLSCPSVRAAAPNGQRGHRTSNHPPRPSANELWCDIGRRGRLLECRRISSAESTRRRRLLRKWPSATSAISAAAAAASSGASKTRIRRIPHRGCSTNRSGGRRSAAPRCRKRPRGPAAREYRRPGLRRVSKLRHVQRMLVSSHYNEGRSRLPWKDVGHGGRSSYRIPNLS